MKIRLVNFRCYSDNTFEFGDDGLVLISAASGSGKSTILMGIQFALFGTGTKVSSYGKTACRVELEFDNMKIVRTKRPNKLILNDEYENDAAQAIINKHFGDTFDVTGYISQNALNSFIIMSPTEKLEFLEKFAFKNIDLGKIKERCKSLITQRNDKLKETIAQLELTNKVVDELKEPIKVNFPLKGKKIDYEKITKNEEIRKKNCDVLIKRNRNTIEKLHEELKDIEVLNTFLNSKNENIESLTEKLAELSLSEKKIQYIGDELLSKYKNTLKTILNQKEFTLLENRYQTDKDKLYKMKEEEINKLNEELQNLSDNTWKDYSEKEIQDTIKETKDILKDAKRISFLNKELKDIIVEDVVNKKEKLEIYKQELQNNKELIDKLEKQKIIYCCPSCNKKLSFRDNKLHINEDDFINEDIDVDNIKKEVIKLKNNIKTLESEISDNESSLKRKNKLEKEINEIKSQYDEDINENTLSEDLEYFENYYKAEQVKNKRILTIKNNIEEDIFSSSYESFKRELSNLERKVNKLKKTFEEFDDEYSEEELRDIIIKEEKNKEAIERQLNEKEKLEEERKLFNKQTKDKKDKHISKYEEIRHIEDIESLIKENKEKIDELETKKEEHIKNLENIQKYNDYIKEKDNYESWTKKLKDLEIQEKDDRLKYSGATLLKEKILEAESIALANIVDSINTHAQLYLDAFFADNPIIVRLLPFKETKKNNKPQINIEIQYKDMECDLNMLSGGELSRVVLAFTLALGEMFNTPMLLLDESTASLDQEATTVVFDAIKENFKGKMVLIIAHQVIQGVFDKIIKL